jgi:flagellin-like protein
LKGVSAIIAVILIVMIVVSLVGLTWTWFNGLINNLQSSTSNATTTATTALGMQASIEVAKFYPGAYPLNYVNATIRNTGTLDINIGKFGVYIDGVFCPSYVPNSGKISPGSTATINITNSTPACPNKVLKITIENGLEDYKTITC